MGDRDKASSQKMGLGRGANKPHVGRWRVKNANGRQISQVWVKQGDAANGAQIQKSSKEGQHYWSRCSVAKEVGERQTWGSGGRTCQDIRNAQKRSVPAGSVTSALCHLQGKKLEEFERHNLQIYNAEEK